MASEMGEAGANSGHSPGSNTEPSNQDYRSEVVRQRNPHPHSIFPHLLLPIPNKCYDLHSRP